MNYAQLEFHFFCDSVAFQYTFIKLGSVQCETPSKHQFLDSLVVRISACHVEGPGSIPGRGGFFFHKLDMTTVVKFCRYTNITNRARVAQSVER